MKKYYFIFLFLLISRSILFASENQFYPDPSACPVEELVIPYKIIATHCTNILKEIVAGRVGLKWKSQNDEGVVRLIFNKSTVIRRFQMNLIGTDNDKLIPIEITWTPQDSTWGVETRYFYMKPDGQTHCFFLGYLAKIPENVPVHEMAFNFPAGLVLQRLSVSDKPSEVVIKSCPMPHLRDKIVIAYDDCLKNPYDMDKERTFVNLFEKSLHRYDCRRSYDYKPVPAWWLCAYEETDKWLRLLSQMKSLEAKKLFGSSLFRSTLDGEYAEEYYEKSRLTGEQFK